MSGTPRERTIPTAEPGTDQQQLIAAFTSCRESLEAVKRSIDGATAAIGVLRTTLREMAPLWRSLEQLEQALADTGRVETMDEAVAAAQEAATKAAGSRPQAVAAAEEATAPGLEEPDAEAPWRAAQTLTGTGRAQPSLDVPVPDGGAPYSYTVTVEEVGARVKLVPLHQSLSQVEGVRELSLKSYTNGVAVISIDAEIELQAPVLEETLSTGMNNACRVTAGEGPSFLVRMGSEAASGGRRQQESIR